VKIFLDLEYISSIPDSYKCDSDRIMQITGINTGNFAFRHALLNLVPNIEEFIPMNWGTLNKLLNQGSRPDKVIVSCANWLCASEEYEKSNGFRASVIEKIDCDVVSFGLGAQARTSQEKLELGKNTIRLANVLSSKCSFLSVRDEFTLNTLKEIGINNAVITGCPSNFINLDMNLGGTIIKKLEVLLDSNMNWPDTKCFFSEFSGGHSYSGKTLKRILTLIHLSQSFYMIQTPIMYPFYLGETGEIHNAYLSNMPDKLDKNLLKKLLKTRLVGFSSIEHWLDFSRTFDFASGMRIHGNMVPLQSGIPAIVIGHDSRTNGLSATMSIPVVSPEAFIEISYKNPGFLFDKMLEGYQSYDTRRAELLDIMLEFIKNNGLN